jgi:hypothetical protein
MWFKTTVFCFWKGSAGASPMTSLRLQVRITIVPLHINANVSSYPPSLTQEVVTCIFLENHSAATSCVPNRLILFQRNIPLPVVRFIHVSVSDDPDLPVNVEPPGQRKPVGT